MQLSIVGPLMESPLVPLATKERLATMVVHERTLIAGNFSEPTTSGLVGTPRAADRARRADGGYRISGRKAFASMLEAADYCAVMAYPDEATAPTAAMILLVPRPASGRRVEEGGTRWACGPPAAIHGPDECWVSDDALPDPADDSSPFAAMAPTGSGPPHTAVYLGSPSRPTKPSSRRCGAERRRGSRSPWPFIRMCAGTWRR